MIRRRFILFVQATALLLFIAATLLWYRTRRAGDFVRWGDINASANASTWTRIQSTAAAGVEIVRDRLTLSGPGQILPERIAAALPQGTKLAIGTVTEGRPMLTSASSAWKKWGFALHTDHDFEVVGQGDSAVSIGHDRTFIIFPIWLAPTLFAIVALTALRRPIGAWRRRRRIRRGHCGKCNYDLRATAGRCPECGEISSSPDVSPLPSWRRIRRIAVVVLILSTIACIGVLAARPSRNSLDLARDVSWFDLGGNLHNETDIEAVEAWHLQFGQESKWFLAMYTPASQLESHVYLFRLFENDDPLFSAAASAQFPIDWSLPLLSPLSRPPLDLPTQDRGGRLSLELRPGRTTGDLSLNLVLSTSSRQLTREVEHRHTNVLPFLFAIYIDGQPIALPETGMSKEGGAIYQIVLVKPNDSRRWNLHIDEKSLRNFLPDSLPHTVSIIAAFSERQHEGSMGKWGFMLYDRLGSMEPGPQLIIRSEPAKLRWTGTAWTTADQ